MDPPAQRPGLFERARLWKVAQETRLRLFGNLIARKLQGLSLTGRLNEAIRLCELDFAAG